MVRRASATLLPSFSPCTGEYRGCAWHCIQSQAARSSQRIPLLLATSSYSGRARLSGALAVLMYAVVTTCGISALYRVLPPAWDWRGETRAGRFGCAARTAPAVADTCVCAGACATV